MNNTRLGIAITEQKIIEFEKIAKTLEKSIDNNFNLSNAGKIYLAEAMDRIKHVIAAEKKKLEWLKDIRNKAEQK